MPDDYWVGVEHGGILEDDFRKGAVKFEVVAGAKGQAQRQWIPRSQLRDYDDDTMIIPRWLAEARGIEPDWGVADPR